MSKDKFSDYDSTAGNNTDIGGINIQGTANVQNFDNALREFMAQTADHFASATVASAATVDIGAEAAHYLTVTGTTTITSLGTVKAGTAKALRFSGALTITHNATSLILPGSANITTAAGDTALFVSEGSGNWRCVFYQRASGAAVGSPTSSTDNAIARFDGTSGKLQNSSATIGDDGSLAVKSTDEGTGISPKITLFRDSASPANGDSLGGLDFTGRDDAAGTDTYAQIYGSAIDVAAGSEDARVVFRTAVGGTLATAATMENAQVLLTSGAPSAPSVSFISESDTGFYRSAAGKISVSIGGSVVANFDANAVSTLSGTAAAPAYAFVSDTDCGMYRRGTDEIGFSTSGTEAAWIGSTGRFFNKASYDNTSASSANTILSSSGGVARSTSAKKYKQDIQDITDIDLSRALQLAGVTYRSKCENDDPEKTHFGIVADQAHELGLASLVVYGDNGEIEGFQYERLTALLLEIIKRHESRISELEVSA